MEVIRALGRFRDSRVASFLRDVILRNEDLAEQELALISLARGGSSIGRRFLAAFYPSCPAHLKPKTAYASGIGRVLELSPLIMADFERCTGATDPNLSKNLILALGELKAFGAASLVHRYLANAEELHPEVRLACAFALGRLERDPAKVSRLEGLFMDDSMAWQAFQSALSQVQIRSQFKLEDYLSKIYGVETPHPMLPSELRCFDPADVEAGMELFDRNHFWRRHLLCSAALPEERREAWISTLEPPNGEWSDYFDSVAEFGGVRTSAKLRSHFESTLPELKTDLRLRLSWLGAFLDVKDPASEAAVFLQGSGTESGIGFLNLWSEWASGVQAAQVKASLKELLKSNLDSMHYSRILRACVELGVQDSGIESGLFSRFQEESNRSSILLYAERFRATATFNEVIPLFIGLSDSLKVAVLGLAEEAAPKMEGKALPGILKSAANGSLEVQIAVLRVLRALPISELEGYAIESVKSSELRIRLNAVIALRGYSKSRGAGECLIEALSDPEERIRGRALDSILANTTLLAKRGALEVLKNRIEDDFVVDKFYRDFDPEKKGGQEWYDEVSKLCKDHPDHSQWEKLAALRERLKPASIPAALESRVDSSPEMKALDERLQAAIPGFDSLDVTTKLALRAAEQPFLQGLDAEKLPIDKAPSVLEFCKALDLILEKHVGQKMLFPKLERELHDFQTHWHRVGFGEEYPQGDRVLGNLGLKGKISPESFPLHKAKLMCATFFNGKILQDRFKIFDGLRAWAVIFLIFARKLPQNGAPAALLKLEGLSDEQCVQISKRLMQLQDLRNPAAHRQTYSDLNSIKVVRSESLELINLILASVLRKA